MSEELIDILTKDGKPTGKTAPKSEIHARGLYHNTAHIWFYTMDGEVLLAQRAASKTLHPLLWDVSVAGHIDAGETVEEGAVREVKEEINLKVNKKHLQKIGVFECFQAYDNGIVDNEFHHTFLVEFNGILTDLIPQEGEVESLKLVSMYEFFEMIDCCGTNLHLVESNKSYYGIVMDAILERIT
ncbi:MAG: NUDIX hydrolase [Aquaticitalea sp.]